MTRRGFCIVALIAGAVPCVPARAAEVAPPISDSSISGVVKDSSTHAPIAGLKVVLTADDGVERVTNTRASGLYVFDGLPVARYTVFVEVGKASISKTREIEEPGRIRMNVSIDPNVASKRVVVVMADSSSEARPVRLRTYRCRGFYSKWARVLRQKARQDARAARRDGLTGTRSPTPAYSDWSLCRRRADRRR